MNCPKCEQTMTTFDVCPRCNRDTHPRHTVKREVPRQHIVEAARTAIGWPFVHRGRSKAGIDCIGLLFHVAEVTGLIENIDIPEYYKTLKYTRHPERTGPDSQWLLREMAGSFIRKPPAKVEKGDIIYCRNYKWVHVGIVTPKTFIHAYAFPHKMVLECSYDKDWKDATVAAFSFAGAV